MTKLLTAKQVAARLQCTPQQVYIMIHDGRLKAIKLSPRMTRVAESEVDKLVGGASA